MKVVLKIRAIGLFGSLIFLNLKPMAACSAVIEPPAITIQKVTAETGNLFTLQYKTNLLSPTWQTVGAFSGSTNLSLSDLPAVFFRGVCSNSLVSVTLTWPASTNSSVVGYKLYYGVASGGTSRVIDVGQATSVTISNLVAGPKYYFAVTTYNSAGVQSTYLTETKTAFQARFSLDVAGIRQTGGTTQMTVTETATNAAAIPPPIVFTKKVTASINKPITLQFTTNLSSPHWQPLGTFTGTTNISFPNRPAVFIRGYCTNLTASATLAWQPSSDPAVVGYKLYYGTTSHDYTSVVNVGASTMTTVSNLVSSSTFYNYTSAVNVGASTMTTVSNLVSGKTYYFAVTAYNSSGLESSFSTEASGVMQARFSLTIGNP